MTFDYSSLNGRIIERFGSQYNFAKEMGLSERSVSLKLNGKVGWKQVEIAKAVEILSIDSTDIPRYFFNLKVQKN
ncbi:Protein of unknown function [Gracilibacillus orientalis]|uniref:Uncharacterized protein n=1 Tax=Gracilibacillus orientalis TaxID=334253 RepID=A0A1I4HBH4_9BACI|nr:DUF739 family protein [Gracilibacillus orientalis]SFL39642.1 Protein of unknown function [Gracilibacillus orientalis]